MDKIANWRIMFQFKRSQPLLLVMGHSEAECQQALAYRFEDWSRADLSEVMSVWTETWKGCWVPLEEISITKHRLRAIARDRQAQKVMR